MSETTLVIGEIIIGIAFLGLVSAVITIIMVRLLPKGRSHAAEILDERYARGELTPDQYAQMRRNIANDVGVGEIPPVPSVNGAAAHPSGAGSSRRSSW
jgi:hypothetical protein